MKAAVVTRRCGFEPRITAIWNDWQVVPA